MAASPAVIASMFQSVISDMRQKADGFRHPLSPRRGVFPLRQQSKACSHHPYEAVDACGTVAFERFVLPAIPTAAAALCAAPSAGSVFRVVHGAVFPVRGIPVTVYASTAKGAVDAVVVAAAVAVPIAIAVGVGVAVLRVAIPAVAHSHPGAVGIARVCRQMVFGGVAEGNKRGANIVRQVGTGEEAVKIGRASCRERV